MENRECTQVNIRTEIINLIRDWDNQDDTPDKLSHRDLAIKIEDIYLKYTRYLLEDIRQRCADNSYIEEVYDGYEFQKQISESSILNTEIILP